MPRYRTEFGVVVNIPEEKAARINGLTPIDPAPSPKAPAAKKAPAKRAGRRPSEN